MSRIIYIFIAVTIFSFSSEVENRIIEGRGEVISKNKIYITSKSEGVLNILVSNNSFIRKGETIAKVTNRKRDIEIRNLRDKILILDREISIQKKKIAISKDKYRLGVGAKNDYLNEELILEQIKNKKKTIQNNYNNLQLESKNSKIIASKDGYIANLIAQNSYVLYGAKIGEIDSKNILIKLFIDIKYAKEIKEGMRVNIESSYKNSEGVIVAKLPRSRNNQIEIIVKPEIFYPIGLKLRGEILLKRGT